LLRELCGRPAHARRAEPLGPSAPRSGCAKPRPARRQAFLALASLHSVGVEALERPLPKPTDAAYVEARLLEALTEARLALEFLERGITRNAAGKAFQAWKALLAALLRLEAEKLKAAAKTEEERKWLESTAIPRVPTTKMVSLALKLEEAGHEGVAAWTSLALNLHDYQYHGPDPDMALSKFRTREEAAEHVRKLAAETARRAEALRNCLRWTEALQRALEELRRALSSRNP